ncbi:MAG TPA: phage capsid protein [Ignavibacteriaceae bacterium]|nr:phage capsid protein [Ignavibacteriaceae bacterium]
MNPTLLKILFARDVYDNLFPNDSFLVNSVDRTEYVDGDYLNEAIAGEIPELIINPTSFPLEVGKRQDVASGYKLDLYATKPTHFRYDENLLFNYDKRMSVLKDHMNVINSGVATNVAYKWAPVGASNIFRTTGDATAVSLAPGATGTRKKLTYADFLAVKTYFDRLDIPLENRHCLINAVQSWELLSIPEFAGYDKTGIAGITTSGKMEDRLGFKIHVRSTTPVYTNGTPPVKKSPTDATATSDNLAVLFWHTESVSRAKGRVETFLNTGLASYIGDIMNVAARAGGGIRHASQKGVLALVQAHG